MFHFLKTKLRSKKWLNGCLLLGIIMLTAAMSCHPMFLYGSLNKLLYAAFQDYIIEENEYPVVIGRSGSYEMDSIESVDDVETKLAAYKKKYEEYLGIDVVTEQVKLKLTGGMVDGSYGTKGSYTDICYMEDMEAHINVRKGVPLSEAETEDGVYPCLISTALMDRYGLTCGEVLTHTKLSDASGNPIRLQVVGIFEESDPSDIFWRETTASFLTDTFVDKDAFEAIMQCDSFSPMSFYHYIMMDYTDIDSHNVDDIQYYLDEFLKADQRMTVNCMELFDAYHKDAKTVTTLLWVLELPVLFLLMVFIYMVSGQILQMETGEIAMMKSRGVSRGEVIRLYIEQSGVLSAVGIVFGIPAGLMLCKLAASTDSFLVFRMKNTAEYGFVWQTLLYALAAAVVAMIFMTLPVIGYSKLSIVQQKSVEKKRAAKQFWERYFLDILLLAVSIYLLYNYKHQQDRIAISVLKGETLDPMVFLNASLFMLAAGLFILRLIHYIVRLIYYLGRNKWSPAMYASFLQITRTFEKQGFISIFLVMTLAMGIFNSNMVRTINENERQRITYDMGADVCYEEAWKMITIKRSKEEPADWLYKESDYGRYTGLLEQGICESTTRVLVDDSASVTKGEAAGGTCRLMGIHTKEFGETATLQDGLNDSHWYNALNALAQTTNGVIISRNLAEANELKVGDTISFDRKNPINADQRLATVSCTIVAVVDAWPGCNSYAYTYDEEGELKQSDHYLLVCNYAFLINVYGQTPYQVWMRLAEGKTPEDVAAYLKSENMETKKLQSVSESMEEMLNSPIIQITNGMYTLSFLIAVILCLAGFLIYWITSIKQRELLFGIYRAMGMNMKEINQMLINEQVFSSLFAVVGGAATGVLATVLFIKLVAVVYLPEAHNIAVEIYSNGWDMVRLFLVVAAMFVVCLAVLRSILKNMKIAQALKLGED